VIAAIGPVNDTVDWGKPQEGEVQVVAMGYDLAWVILPGEILVSWGCKLNKARRSATQ
jgi:hypothetical protein